MPQSVIVEVAYVVQSQYAVTECRWKSVLEIWPDTLTGLGDSVIVAVAMAARCDAAATFDRRFANKLQIFGLESYF